MELSYAVRSGEMVVMRDKDDSSSVAVIREADEVGVSRPLSFGFDILNFSLFNYILNFSRDAV